MSLPVLHSPQLLFQPSSIPLASPIQSLTVLPSAAVPATFLEKREKPQPLVRHPSRAHSPCPCPLQEAKASVSIGLCSPSKLPSQKPLLNLSLTPDSYCQHWNMLHSVPHKKWFFSLNAPYIPQPRRREGNPPLSILPANLSAISHSSQSPAVTTMHQLHPHSSNWKPALLAQFPSTPTPVLVCQQARILCRQCLGLPGLRWPVSRPLLLLSLNDPNPQQLLAFVNRKHTSAKILNSNSLHVYTHYHPSPKFALVSTVLKIFPPQSTFLSSNPVTIPQLLSDPSIWLRFSGLWKNRPLAKHPYFLCPSVYHICLENSSTRWPQASIFSEHRPK